MFDQEPLMHIAVDVGPPQEIGAVNGLVRRCVPITGGSVSGGLEGVILPGGADWQTVSPNGAVDIAARYTLQLTDGLVEVESTGVRHPSAKALEQMARGEPVTPGEVYFRTAMRFRTASPALEWLNTVLAVSTGSRPAHQVLLTVYRVP